MVNKWLDWLFNYQWQEILLMSLGTIIFKIEIQINKYTCQVWDKDLSQYKHTYRAELSVFDVFLSHVLNHYKYYNTSQI